MAIIKKSCIEDIKARVSLYDVVSSTVSLRKAGSSWKGLSPFTEERTPSFFVTPDRGLYKCFSTGKAGDIFTFVMETERLTFTEAVETIAGRFGIELLYEEGGAPAESRSHRQELLAIHELATDYFHKALFAANGAAVDTRRYWEEIRAFPLEVAKEFHIGLSPLDGRPLVELCLKKGISLEAVKDCGLFYQRGTRLNASAFMPRFRGRLMIPIRDHQGRVIAFTARQLEITPQEDPSHDAKYINSPETPLFSKSNILFGLDRARMAANNETPFLLVEGQLDALRCWHSGLKTAIAPQGTAITEHQLLLLRRYSSRIDCLLDGDQAGQKAALRILPMTLKLGLEARFFVLPPGQDPDSLLQKGGLEAWQRLAQTPISAMSFAASAILPDPKGASPQQKAQAATRFYEIIGASDSEVARSEYLRETAGLLKLDRESLIHDFSRHLIAKQSQRRPSPPPANAPEEPERLKMLTSVEESLLLLCIHQEELGKPLANAINHEWISTDTMAGSLLNRALAEFEHDMWQGPESLEHLAETQDERNLIHSLTFAKPDFENPITIANEALQHLYRNALTRKIRKIELEIASKSETLNAAVILLQRKRNEYHRKLLLPPRL
jgi:DNA primase